MELEATLSFSPPLTRHYSSLPPSIPIATTQSIKHETNILVSQLSPATYDISRFRILRLLIDLPLPPTIRCTLNPWISHCVQLNNVLKA